MRMPASSAGLSSTLASSSRMTLRSFSSSTASMIGARDHVGEDVDGLEGGGVGHLRVVDGDFAVGRGVVHAADGFDRFGDLARGRAAGCALKEHVFEEVGEAGLFVVFVAAARPDVEADGGGAGVWHFAVTTRRPFESVVRWYMWYPWKGTSIVAGGL